PPSRRSRGGWKLDDERRPLAAPAARGDAAAVRLDDRLRDVEAEAGALDLPLERRLRAEEPLEQASALLLRDPDPRVGDLEAHRPVLGPERDVDPSAGRRELDRVRDEIVEQLREAGALTLDGRYVVGAHVQLDPRRVGARARSGYALVDERAQVDGLQLQLEPAALEPCGEQEVADQPEQPLRVPFDHLEVGPRALVGLLGQQLHVP